MAVSDMSSHPDLYPMIYRASVWRDRLAVEQTRAAHNKKRNRCFASVQNRTRSLAERPKNPSRRTRSELDPRQDRLRKPV